MHVVTLGNWSQIHGVLHVGKGHRELQTQVEQQSVIETCFTALLDVALVLNAAELDGNMATTDMSGSYAVDVFGKLQVNVCFRCDNGLTSSQNIESWTL